MPFRPRVAVIDTTLLCRLVDVGLTDRLPFVFDRVHIPADVISEVVRGPGRARRKLKNLLRTERDFYCKCTEEDPMVRDLLKVDLDLGEAAVIAQADRLGAIAIIDESKGHTRAEAMSVAVLRTGAVLCQLKDAGAIQTVREYLVKLQRLGFRLSKQAELSILEAADELGSSPRR